VDSVQIGLDTGIQEICGKGREISQVGLDCRELRGKQLDSGGKRPLKAESIVVLARESEFTLAE
jgi:hypothetical protein